MKCSVVINTMNRANTLEAVIEELCYQNFDLFEIVVVIGPSRDRSFEMLNAWSDLIKVVKCPVANLCVSRNLGLLHASGDIVLFIDDDAVPQSEDWIRNYVDVFEADEDEKVVVSGSSVKTHFTDYYEFRKGWASSFGMQLFEGSESGSLAMENAKGLWFERVIGCNNAMRLSRIREIGGFDENYSYYADETDLCIRVIDSGGKVLNIEDNTVRHFKELSGIRKSFDDQRWDVFARSDMYFSLKNGKLPLLLRIFAAGWLAWKKHYVSEIFDLWRRKEVDLSVRLKALARLLIGMISGYFLACKKRRLKTDWSDESSTPFCQLDKQNLLIRIRSAAVLSGNSIRRSMTAWGGRSYPLHETFQVYYKTASRDWSEVQSEICFYRIGKRVHFEIALDLKGEDLEVRVDPCKGVGQLLLHQLEVKVDKIAITPSRESWTFIGIRKQCGGDKNEELEAFGEDPQIYLGLLGSVRNTLQVQVELEFEPSLFQS